MNFIKFWSADNWQKGYSKGIADGKNNKVRNPVSYQFIRPFNFIWKFDQAAETYSQGYKRGYHDGKKIYHKVYGTTTSKGGTKMASNTGIVASQSQLDNLIDEIYKTRAEILNEFVKLRNEIVEKGNQKQWSDLNYINFSSAFDAVYNDLVSAFDEHGPFSMFEQHLSQLGIILQKYKNTHPVITQLSWKKSGGSWL
jgi:hypothetical protein